MKIAILVIGDEILEGHVLDTNSTYIAKRLAEKGLSVDKFLTIPDSAVADGVKALWDQYDIVITSGGLGPTHDDVTIAGIEKVLPFSKKPLTNTVGQAAGMCIEEQKKVLFALPGVARECEEMFDQECLSRIEERMQEKEILFMQRVNLACVFEKDIEKDITKASEMVPGISVGSYPHFFVVSLILRGKCVTEEEFQKKCAPIVAFLQEKYANHIFPAKTGKIEEALHTYFIEKGKTLSLAESCTGGSLAASFTKIPGASKYFQASAVVYSDSMKQTFLDVPQEAIQKHGAVSPEIVEKMVEGLLQKTNTDYGIAVSGIAGPDGGTEEKPIGTVFASIKEKNGKIFSGKIPMGPNKPRIVYMEITNTYLMCALFRYIAYGIEPFHDHK